jgi:hypothetical protein
VGAYGFRRTRQGRIVLRLDDVERHILTDLVGQLVELVDEGRDDRDLDPLARMVGIDPDAERPDDPALARLFPDAYPDDVEAADEFRRFTQMSLRDTKLAHARTVLASLERSGSKLTLGEPEAQAWLGSLNDLRLTLGSRLDLTEDNHGYFDSLPEDDPSFVLYHVYDWLTFLQETLVQSVIGAPAATVGDDA